MSWRHHALSLRWRHNDHAGVSNHQPHGCLLNRLFRRKPKKTSKLRVNGLCAGNSPGTGEFPAQMASYAEDVSIWWRHHYVLGRGIGAISGGVLLEVFGGPYTFYGTAAVAALTLLFYLLTQLYISHKERHSGKGQPPIDDHYSSPG